MDEEMQRYRIEQARAYLESIADISKQLHALRLRAIELRTIACGIKGIDYSKDMISISSNGDAVPEAVAALDELADSASGKADELAEMVDECSTSLESLGGWKSALLDMHYLSGKTLVEIGKMDEWKHKRQYMSVLHLQALDEFYDHMPHYRRDPKYPAI